MLRWDQYLIVRLFAGGVVRGWVDNTNGISSAEQATGWVDPIITIDPGWAFADEYELWYSEGVVQYVPEPSAISLLAISAMIMMVLLRPRMRT